MIVNSMQTVLVPPHADAPSDTGLTTADVQARIQRGETNQYQARVNRTYSEIVLENVFNLFNIVLFTLLVFVVALGDYSTAIFAGFSVVTNTFLGMFQEINAKRKLDQLAMLSEQQVRVRRDTQVIAISMRDVVKDDILLIEPGDKLVVDGVVVQTDAMEMDESLLTGESDAIFKQPGDEVFSGSFCIAGAGVMRATRVGKDSNINKLSEIARAYKRIRTPTQVKIDILVELAIVVMLVCVPMLFMTAYLQNLELLQAMRNAVVFVTSLVPQGLVLVAILSLTIGAIRISRHQTLIQKVNAVESLANCTTLCFDKTGTLTKNQLAVQQIIILNHDDRANVLRDLDVYLKNLAHHNRTAAAVTDYVQQHLTQPQAIKKIREIPFTSGRKWGAVVLPDKTLILGAPERLLPSTQTEDSVAYRAYELSKQGLRVLAFVSISGELDAHTHDIGSKTNPIALIVLSDQVREDIQQTLEAFRQEHIGLKVISGDSLETVQAIAAQSGMDITGAYTGAQLDAMPDTELEGIVQQANVFARIEPETKRRIIKALQKHKQYVAMVGDGVNDVPALKQANLAIVMNDGTQISKDVADIVLLNNAMSTLPLAFKEGKEITQTIFGTMKMFLIKNFYSILLFIFIAFMSLPFPITPVQISWATFGTVNVPATLIAFSIVRPEWMWRFRRDVLDYILTGGFIGSVLLALLYCVTYLGTNRDIEATRSAVTLFMAFYGSYVVCSIQGVNFYQPKTFIQHWRIVLMMTVLCTLTVLALYLLPGIFEFRIFTWAQHGWVMVLITALFLLSIILLAHGMKYRYLLRRMWHLFQEDED
jgi:cation-transporting ATPase E